MRSHSLSTTGLCADEQLAAQGEVLPGVHSGPPLRVEASPARFDARQETSLQRNRMLWRTTEPFLRCYGTALLFVTAALISTLLLQHMFPYPFLFLFFAAVMASAWFGGTGSGLFAVLASTLAVDYFFVPQFRSFAVNATD